MKIDNSASAMAEASQGSQAWEPLGDPPENVIGTRVPNWLLGHDEIGYQIVLVMQVRHDNESESNTPIRRLPSPFVIGASVEQLIGPREARKISATKENRGTKYLLRTDSRSAAEKLLSLTELVDGTQVEIVVHNTLNSVQGIVYDIDSVDDDEQDILKYLQPQGVINVRRIRKRVNNALRNTPLLVLTLKGAVLPQSIYFGLIRLQMNAYYPLPLLCYNCGVYGHSRKVCKGASICLNCSKELHVAEGERCENPKFCLHCKNDHSVTSRDCPTYQQEKRIIQHKVDNRVSFGEARRVLNERQKDSYASALQQRLHQVELEKDSIIKALRNELEAVKAELELLRKAVQTTPQSSTTSERTETSPPECIVPKETQTTIQTPSTSGAANGTRASGNQNNGRKSRKDKASMSPPKKSLNYTIHPMELRNRSRSDKRSNTSPPDIDGDSKEKRRHVSNNDGCK